MKTPAHQWSNSLVNTPAWENILVTYRRRRAYVRGHLWLLTAEFLERTNRADHVVLPDLQWYNPEHPSVNGSSRFESGPWTGPLDPTLDRLGYSDRLVKALVFRIAGFRRRINLKGMPYNKPVWIEDWGKNSPPQKTYLRGCHLVDGCETLDHAGWARVISEYRARYTNLQRWWSYYATLMTDMQDLERSCLRFQKHADEAGMIGLPTMDDAPQRTPGR